MTSNVINLPTYGKAISLDDQGVYFVLNESTSTVQSIFQLAYDDEWYLYQLEKTSVEDEARWSVMAEGDDLTLMSMPTAELTKYFSRPEYAEPRGAWQVIRNGKYGFGKFTPVDQSQPISHAMLLFSDNEMLEPVRIHKADEETLNRAEQASQQKEAVLT